MQKIALIAFMFAAVVLVQAPLAPSAHAETTESTSVSAKFKALQDKIAQLQEQIKKLHGKTPLVVKMMKGKKDDHKNQGNDDGSDVEVEIKNGTTTVIFVHASTTHTVIVGTTTESGVLTAVALKLGVAVSALDAKLVADIKAELARKLEKKGGKMKNKFDKKFNKKDESKRKDVARHIALAEKEIAKAKTDGATDADLTDAKKLLADAKTALVAKKYKEAKELAKDAREEAKDWDEEEEDEDDN